MPDLNDLLFVQHDLLSTRQAQRFFTPSAIRHRLRRGTWLRPHRGVYLTAPAELSRAQRRWVAVLAAPGSLLGGRTALEEAGLTGFASSTVELILPGELIEQLRRALIAGGWRG